MRTRRCFRVVLNAEDGFVFVAQALNAVVIQINVRHFNLIGKRTGGNRKSVVMAGNGNGQGRFVSDRLISASMPKLEFVRGATEG